jgi:hypothetical protein
VNLHITAISGPGNLLGNLLCSVTHLLDNNPLTGTQLSQVLNLVQTLLQNIGLLNL